MGRRKKESGEWSWEEKLNSLDSTETAHSVGVQSLRKLT